MVTPEPIVRTLQGGIEIVAQRIESPRPIPSPTARHEAAHVVVAGEIVEATIIRHGNALGSVRPVRMTAASAAAAGAIGYSGTGWDRFVTENIIGVSWESAKGHALAQLSGKTELLEEVAVTLEREKTITQHHVDQAKKRVVERKHGIFPVRVEIYRSGKLIRKEVRQSTNGEVEIPQVASVFKKLNSPLYLEP